MTGRITKEGRQRLDEKSSCYVSWQRSKYSSRLQRASDNDVFI